ncbi:MAG: hypothetical protein HYZ53_17920 [Planctomycetes bacterium]|nr:hypothetical protein [Planctomycetota bacterium]
MRQAAAHAPARHAREASDGLAKAVREDPVEARQELVDALALFANRLPAVASLLEVALGDTKADVRISALHAFATMKDAALPFLVRVARGTNARVGGRPPGFSSGSRQGRGRRSRPWRKR